MITDINNPAASAQAQSELAVMFDMIGGGTSGVPFFNHIPGGCNLLYLDGHVKFVKYPGENAPGESFVNAVAANAIGVIASAW